MFFFCSAGGLVRYLLLFASLYCRLYYLFVCASAVSVWRNQEGKVRVLSGGRHRSHLRLHHHPRSSSTTAAPAQLLDCRLQARLPQPRRVDPRQLRVHIVPQLVCVHARLVHLCLQPVPRRRRRLQPPRQRLQHVARRLRVRGQLAAVVAAQRRRLQPRLHQRRLGCVGAEVGGPDAGPRRVEPRRRAVSLLGRLRRQQLEHQAQCVHRGLQLLEHPRKALVGCAPLHLQQRVVQRHHGVVGFAEVSRAHDVALGHDHLLALVQHGARLQVEQRHDDGAFHLAGTVRQLPLVRRVPELLPLVMHDLHPAHHLPEPLHRLLQDIPDVRAALELRPLRDVQVRRAAPRSVHARQVRQRLPRGHEGVQMVLVAHGDRQLPALGERLERPAAVHRVVHVLRSGVATAGAAARQRRHAHGRRRVVVLHGDARTRCGPLAAATTAAGSRLPRHGARRLRHQRHRCGRGGDVAAGAA
eukprot:Rhum_TRINITY_DN25313_c0_g1::Rhum_TRINITY_DN25313_c0_g1_i1::g.181808::m.181808